MSEYQYYEFQTADRRLSEMEMHELRAYSTRAEITATSFVNEYNFGNFKGDEDAWMEKYFDGFLYVANWGTHILQLGLPATVLSRKTAGAYCGTDAARVREKSGRIIITFISQNEDGGDWEEGGGVLSSLMPLRTEMARGDLRCLYLGWLLSMQCGMLADEESEPPMPANLGNLSGSLARLADFLRIDPDLISVAADASVRKRMPSGSHKEMSAWLATLPLKEKDKFLLKLMEGGGADIAAELLSQFNRRPGQPKSTPAPARRTVGELLKAAETLRAKRGH